jgi:hypothetical protein
MSISGNLGPIHVRFDKDFFDLVRLAKAKGLKLRRQSLGVGYTLTYPHGSKIIFKSYSKLKLEIENFDHGSTPI